MVKENGIIPADDIETSTNNLKELMHLIKLTLQCPERVDDLKEIEDFALKNDIEIMIEPVQRSKLLRWLGFKRYKINHPNIISYKGKKID